MCFYKVIKEIENELFKEIKAEVLNDELLLKKINKNKLTQILDVQEDILKEYIENFQVDKKDLHKISEFYENSEISFEVVYRVLNFIRDKIVLYLKKVNVSKEEIIEFSKYLFDLINFIAKIYLKKEIKRFENIKNDIFKDKLLIKIHIDWMEQIILAIEKENPQYFPVMSVQECPFSRYLYYPESLMICLDKRLCTYLDDMHRMVHKLADTFYYHFKSKEWVEGYFVFKDFFNQIKKFIKTISEMYYITYSNPEKSFFKLLELLAFEKRVYVTLIDFLNFDELIKKYSEKVVLKALDILKEKIYNNGFYSDSFLLIKALSAEFYMLNMNISPSRYKEFIERIKKLVNEKIEVDGVEIYFKPVIVGAEIDVYKNLKDYEFIKLLTKLEERAIKEKKEIILLVEEEKAHIDTILDHKYDGQYVLQAFDNENIDIAAQPILDVKSNKIMGIEILGRIKENNKLIPMEKFYEQIEKMDLIKSLDLMVGLKMGTKGHMLAKISNTIFVNVDFETLLNKSYINNILKIKKKYGVDIILEIADIDFDLKYQILIDLHKEFGIEFAIDNFEKQCFSLEVFIKLLTNKVVKYIKVSKHLFYNKEVLSMIEMIKFLEKSFDVKIIIKYVEDKDLYNKVIQKGFYYVQGFYIKTPRAIEELIIDDRRGNV